MPNEHLTVFADNLEDIKQSCAENMMFIMENTPQESTGKQRQWIEFLSRELGESVEDIEVEFRKLRIKKLNAGYQDSIEKIARFQQRRVSKGRGGGVTDAQIEAAREYPIKQLFVELTGGQVKANMAKCPFHPDKTASLSLGKYNRYNCFGCDAKGDSIDLYMKVEGCGFVESVKALS